MRLGQEPEGACYWKYDNPVPEVKNQRRCFVFARGVLYLELKKIDFGHFKRGLRAQKTRSSFGLKLQRNDRCGGYHSETLSFLKVERNGLLSAPVRRQYWFICNN